MAAFLKLWRNNKQYCNFIVRPSKYRDRGNLSYDLLQLLLETFLKLNKTLAPRQKPRRVGYNPRKCGSVKPTKQPEWLSSLPCPYFIIKNRTCQYKKKIDDLAKSCPFVTVVKATLPQGCGSENHLRDYYIQRKIKSQYLEKIFCVVGKRHIFFYFWI